MREHGEPTRTSGRDAVRARLDELLGDEAMPSGTLAALALYDLFLSEVRQQGWPAADKAWSALGPSVIQDVRRQLERLCSPGGGADHVLPAGTEMLQCMGGSVIVGRETLGFDVDRPGLHSDVDLPTRPGGTNLELLLRHVDALSRGLPCRAIGSPIVVARFDGRHFRDRLRYPAFAAAGGVQLERSLDFLSWGDWFCSWPEAEVVDFAGEVVADMGRLWDGASTVARQVRHARAVAERAAADLHDVQLLSVTVDLGRQEDLAKLALGVGFDAWDHAFRRGVVAQEFAPSSWPPLVLDVAALDRADAVAAVRARDADGRIGSVARAVVAAAPQGHAAVLANLAIGYETVVVLGTGDRPLRVRLYWCDGEIRAETWFGHVVDISPERIVLHGGHLPETLIDGLLGRPLHQLFGNPFRCDATISAIANGSWGVVVETAPDFWLVDCSSGRMWHGLD